MTKYCIIDDEPIAHRIIEGYCEHLPYLQKVGNCYDAFEGMQLLNKSSVDLIFLDINMPKLSGFDLLKTMQQPAKVIVTSAHKEFALEGYELNIVDYLLKPFSFERFLKAVNKALPSQTSSQLATSQDKTDKRIFLRGDKKLYQIHLSDILFIEAYGNFTKVYLVEEMILSNKKISALEELLPKEDFLRVHKSYIISTQKIKTIERNQVTIGKHTIPVGQTYKNNLKRFLSHLYKA